MIHRLCPSTTPEVVATPLLQGGRSPPPPRTTACRGGWSSQDRPGLVAESSPWTAARSKGGARRPARSLFGKEWHGGEAANLLRAKPCRIRRRAPRLDPSCWREVNGWIRERRPTCCASDPSSCSSPGSVVLEYLYMTHRRCAGARTGGGCRREAGGAANELKVVVGLACGRESPLVSPADGIQTWDTTGRGEAEEECSRQGSGGTTG